MFIERVFEECLTYEGEMDYKSYLDFVLAMEKMRDRASLEFFLRLLDVRQKGYLDAFRSIISSEKYNDFWLRMINQWYNTRVHKCQECDTLLG